MEWERRRCTRRRAPCTEAWAEVAGASRSFTAGPDVALLRSVQRTQRIPSPRGLAGSRGTLAVPRAVEASARRPATSRDPEPTVTVLSRPHRGEPSHAAAAPARPRSSPRAEAALEETEPRVDVELHPTDPLVPVVAERSTATPVVRRSVRPTPTPGPRLPPPPRSASTPWSRVPDNALFATLLVQDEVERDRRRRREDLRAIDPALWRVLQEVDTELSAEARAPRTWNAGARPYLTLAAYRPQDDATLVDPADGDGLDDTELMLVDGPGP